MGVSTHSLPLYSTIIIIVDLITDYYEWYMEQPSAIVVPVIVPVDSRGTSYLGTTTVDYVLSVAPFFWNAKYLSFLEA